MHLYVPRGATASLLEEHHTLHRNIPKIDSCTSAFVMHMATVMNVWKTPERRKIVKAIEDGVYVKLVTNVGIHKVSEMKIRWK
mmetsp:Transcript_93649/g.129040  ORF Transcript_93649/g.129040 Transcript_93649/m.129040 type:complete len:83 (-) Transcript_93649:308-556(-)